MSEIKSSCPGLKAQEQPPSSRQANLLLSPCSSQGLAGGHGKHVAGCCCARASELKGMLPPPHCRAPHSLQQAVHARRVPPVAIDGDLQVRVVPVIPQDEPDTAMEARLEPLPAGCLQHPQLRAGISTQEQDQGLKQRNKGLKIKAFWSLTACIYWRAEWTGSLKAVWHQSDNELWTLGKSLSQSALASLGHEQPRQGEDGREHLPQKNSGKCTNWDIAEFGNTIEALLI